MRKLFTTLTVLLGLIACEQPAPEEPNPPMPGPGPEEKELFDITVQEDKLSAYSVVFDIRPTDSSATYYYDIISKARLSTINVAEIKGEIVEGCNRMAELTGATVAEVLSQMLTTGNKLNIDSNAGYRPDTEYCVYAFYWEGTSTEFSVCEFKTKEATPSSESTEISVNSLDSYSMVLDITPSSGVTEYWYYFEERTKGEAMLAGLEDDTAFISYHAMNVGTHLKGAQSMEHRGLKPDTEYMVLVMGIDNQLNRFLVEEVFTTEPLTNQERVESALFTELVGEWNGTQTLTDLYNPAEEFNFTVTIKGSLDDHDYDYRANNQLVALVDGWCRIPYYGITELIAEGIEDAENKFGPKWLFNIAEGDVVTLDGQTRNSVIGWLFFGDCFMLNISSDGMTIDLNTDFEVVVSEDRNTITIKSPATMEGMYPSLGYNFSGFGWMGYYVGCSDIVLTRK